MSKDAAHVWELIAKLGTAAAFIGAALISYHEYSQTANREARKPFLQKQLDLCVQAADSAATIATASVQKPDDVTGARATFQRLYWGSLAIFDNQPIYEAMTAFNDLPKSAADGERQYWAEEIAHSCRDLLVFGWDVHEPLDILQKIAEQRRREGRHGK